MQTEAIDGKTFIVRDHEHGYDCLQFSATRQRGPWGAYCLVDRVAVPDWQVGNQGERLKERGVIHDGDG